MDMRVTPVPPSDEIDRDGTSVSGNGAAFRVVLINPYELGRQPFALAQPAAWLREAGFEVRCLDLSRQRLDVEELQDAGLIAIFLGMHTATRIAVEILPRLRERLPAAHYCAFGLYAPLNEALLGELGVTTLLGGECEPDLLRLAETLRAGMSPPVTNRISTARVVMRVPDRSDLPALDSYARLRLVDGSELTVGFTEASRGCKHVCRHCPVVPVYDGRFRTVPLDVVLADVAQQVAAGARHISFGDPDFLNGSRHAQAIVRALHEAHPEITYDCTIKVEHLRRRPELLTDLAATGCLWIISAVEEFDDAILERLDKGHTREDFIAVLHDVRRHGIALAPTFMPFTPWTTLEGYISLLRGLLELGLVNSVPPVQLAIRLLVPTGSRLLELDEMGARLGPFDRDLLGYPWSHEDARVDVLQREVMAFAAEGEAEGTDRPAIFQRIWRASHDALGVPVPDLEGADYGPLIPALDEPWYCCAEPTEQQLGSF